MHFSTGLEEQVPKRSSLASLILLDLGLFIRSDDMTRRWNDIFM